MRWLVGLACLLVLGAINCGRRDQPLNLLLISLDTTRADRFGFSGHEGARTPNFDKFVRERAVWFSDAITAAPITFPSHSTIMTGTFPVFHGVHDNDGYYLDEDVLTLAEVLSRKGFTTGAVLAAYPLNSGVNLDQGFDTYDDDFQADWTTAERDARGDLSFGFLERKADRVNTAVGRWLAGNSTKHFFLWVHYFDPHQPYNPPAPYSSQFPGNGYDGEVAFLDEQFGKLLEMLEDRGLRDNTVIAIVGDHGESLDQHGEPTHAHYLYDPTVRVPLLIAAPGRFRPGSQVSSQVRTVDVAPTLLDLLELAVPAEMQGRSLKPLLEEPTLPWSEDTIIESYFNRAHYGWAPIRALRTDRWKYTEAPQRELYDLQQDPTETINLAQTETLVVEELSQRLYRLARRWGADSGRSTLAKVNDEARQKLMALGYLGGVSTASERAAEFPAPSELAEMANPMEKSQLLRNMNFLNELIRNQRFDDALPLVYRSLELDPENYQLHVYLARALAPLGLLDKALEAARRAQILQPEDAQAFSIAARIHTLRGEFDEAVQPLIEALELQPERTAILNQLGACYLALNREEEAISHFEASLELDAGSWTTQADLANAYFRVDRWEDAQKTYQRALELNPYSATLRYQIAMFYQDVGNSEFSLRLLGEVLRIAPNHLAANLRIGEHKVEVGDAPAARPYLERVVELAPESSEANRSRAVLAGLK